MDNPSYLTARRRHSGTPSKRLGLRRALVVFAVFALCFQIGLGAGQPAPFETAARGPASEIPFASFLICTSNGLVEYQPEADDRHETPHAFPHCPLCLSGQANIAGIVPHPIHLPAGCTRSNQVAYDEFDFRPQARMQGGFRSRAPPLFS